MAQNNPNIRAERISGHLDLNGATAGDASLRIRVGVTPSSPFDGDIWYNGINLIGQINGTYSILNGNGGGSLSIPNTQIVYGNTSSNGVTSSSNFIFDNANSRFQLGSGITARIATVAGTNPRFITTDSNGDLSSFRVRTSDPVAITNIIDPSNWNSSNVYIGPSLTNLIGGQHYSDASYFYYVTANNTVCRVLQAAAPIDTNQIAYGTGTGITSSINLIFNESSGAEYGMDYSADYTDRSLVDKAYVDLAVSSIVPINVNENEIAIGGDDGLTSNPNFTFDGDEFILVSDSEVSLQAGDDSYLSSWVFLDVNEGSLGFGETFIKVRENSFVLIGGGEDIFTSDVNTIVLGSLDGSNLSISRVDDSSIFVSNDGLGIQYSEDYSVDYTDRSLVDKAYVDTKVNVGTTNIAFGDDDGVISGDSNFQYDGSTFKSIAGLRNKVEVINSDITLDHTNYKVLMQDGGDVVLLPVCDDSYYGTEYVIKNIADYPHNIKVKPQVGDTIDGLSSDVVLSGLNSPSGRLNGITLTCDGVSWYITGNVINP